MTIRNRLLILAFVPIIVLSVLASISLLVRQQVVDTFWTHETVDDITLGVFDLNLLVRDYVYFQHERAQVQWQAKYGSVGDTISGLQASSVAEQLALDRLHASYEQVDALFSSLAVAAREVGPYREEMVAILTGELFMASQIMITDCSILADIAEEELLTAQQRAAYVFWPTFILVVLGGLAGSLLIHRSIAKPVRELTKGAEIAGSGNLDYRVGTSAKDEIGALSRTFDQMTKNLKAVTTSRDRLDREVTERKQVERQLKLRAEMLDSAGDEVVLTDMRGHILYANEAFCRHTGYTMEELLKMTLRQTETVESASTLRTRNKELLKKGELIAETEVLRKDGTWFLSEQHARVVESAGEKLTLCIGRDITERKQTEDALCRSEKQASTAIEAARAITFNYDIATGKIEWGGAIDEITGYTSEEFAKVDIDAWAEGIHPDDRDETLSILQDAVGQDRATAEYRFKTKKGYISLASISLTEKQDDKAVRLVGILQDITERKQAQESLIRLSNAVRMATDSIVISNLEGQIIDVNEATLKMYGADDKRDLIGRNSLHLIAPDEQERALEGMGEALEKGQLKQREYHIVAKDGSQILVEMNVGIMQDADGKAVGFVGVTRDITERKQAQEAVQRSERYFRALTENASDAIGVLNSDGILCYVSPSTERLSGYKKEELLAKSPFDFVHPDDLPRLMDLMAHGIQIPGYQVSVECRARHKDGSWRNVEIAANNLLQDPVVAGIVMNQRDVTERKEAEEKLRESEERYHSLFESMLNALAYCKILVDEHNQPIDYVHLEVNDAWETSVGLKKEDVIGRNVTEVIPGIKESEPDLISIYGKVALTGEPAAFDAYFEPLRKWFTLSVYSPEKGYFVVVFENITERKRADEELRSSREQMRNLSAHLQSVREQERTQIAREIHDELGQILTALKMDVAWLRRRLPEGQEPLLNKTKSMSDLIDATAKTVTRMSTELRPGLLDDLGIIAAIEWQAGEFTSRTEIECELVFDSEDIVLDQDRSTTIFRILQETLTNVARHSKATRVKVSLKQKDTDLVLRVRDNGKGIAPDSVSAPRSFGLMGIRERAHAWGGDVKISGVPDKGTTVVASIPLVERKADDKDTRR